MATKTNWALLAGLCVIAAVVILIVHPSPFTPETETQFWAHNDGLNIHGNYKAIASLTDTLQWWHGT